MMRKVQSMSFFRPVPVQSIQYQVYARERSLPHLGRKFYHFLMGMACFSLYAFVLDRAQALMLLIGLGGALVVGDLIRLRFQSVNSLALRLFGGLMRREELKSVSGNSFYVLGLLTVVLFFPKPIVLLSVLFLAIGDPSAAVVGSLFGKHKLIGKKSIEGAVANLSLSAFAAFLFGLFYMQLGLGNACLLGIIGGMISMVAELCPAPVDDNFTIPVISAILLSVVLTFLPIF